MTLETLGVVTVTAQKPDPVRDVDPATAARVLVRAAAHRAPVTLVADVNGDAVTLRGTVVQTTDAGLDVRVDGLNGVGDEVRAAGRVHGRMKVGDTRYAFETSCVGDPSEEPHEVLRLRCPSRITSFERRRSARRRFRETAVVNLKAAAGGDEESTAGMMLNLSGEGMACRVRTSDAARLQGMDTLRVVFSIAGDDTPFDFDARIVSVTEAGTPGQRVVGLEFLDNERLRCGCPRLYEMLDEAV